MMNGTQVKALFEKEAVLFGAVEGVPENKAIELFGNGAVEFSKRLPGTNCNGFGIGDYTAFYLTYRGFQMAATFVNVQELRKERASL